MHEIITLQFGQQANYVGTHFWNSQESYFTYGGDEESPVNHDVHFKPGLGADGSETYTPRTVIYDLKGGFGTLRRDNALYRLEGDDDRAQQGQWPGQTQVIQQPAIEPSGYQTALDSGLEPPPLTTSTVRYWSDYNRVFYHPKSVVQIYDYELNSSIAPFERHSSGKELFAGLDKEHDLLDRDLRPFLEEADHLQAVQIFASADDAWGGFTSEYVERVRDELGKTGIWVWALEDGMTKPRDKQDLHSANVIQTVAALSETATMYIPLTSTPRQLPSYIQGFQPGSKWHTSALQAAAIESLTLASRLRDPNTSLDEYVSVLSPHGQTPIAQLSLSLSRPETSTNGASTHDDRMPQSNGHAGQSQAANDTLQLEIPFTPALHRSPTVARESTLARAAARPHQSYSQVQSYRGAFLSTLELDEINSGSRNRRSAAAASGQRLLARQTGLLVPVGSSVPDIFPCAREGKMAATAALGIGKDVALWLKLAAEMSRRLIGVEEREAIVEGLLVRAGEYEEEMDGWGDDSDDDD